MCYIVNATTEYAHVKVALYVSVVLEICLVDGAFCSQSYPAGAVPPAYPPQYPAAPPAYTPGQPYPSTTYPTAPPAGAVPYPQSGYPPPAGSYPYPR